MQFLDTNTSYDLVVLGAGISGLSVAWWSHLNGKSCAVIDVQSPGAEASGAPMGLLNPATGRKAKKSWQAHTLVPFTNKLLEEVSASTGTSFHYRNGVIRPALTHTIAEDMKHQFEKETRNWPEGWVEWLDCKSIRDRFPGLACSEGGLWVPVASTVSLNLFTKAMSHYLETKGVDIVTGNAYDVSGRDPWVFHTDNRLFTSHKLVHATGSHLATDPHWNYLPLAKVKGQLLTVHLKKPMPFSASVSSLGYIAVNPDNRLKVTLGSTYEHSFKHENADTEGASWLIDRLAETVPELRESIQATSGWAGIRVTTPDRKPVVGPHPDIPDLYVIGGLGSKGLLFGPYCGKLLADHLWRKATIPELFSPERFNRGT